MIGIRTIHGVAAAVAFAIHGCAAAANETPVAGIGMLTIHAKAAAIAAIAIQAVAAAAVGGRDNRTSAPDRAT